MDRETLQKRTCVCIMYEDAAKRRPREAGRLNVERRKEGMHMPHVTIRMGRGRTESERMACARAVAEAIAATVDVKDEPMIVSVMEAPQEEWTALEPTEENVRMEDVNMM